MSLLCTEHKSEFVDMLCENAVSPATPLWMNPKILEPIDSDRAFASFDEYLRWHGYENPLTAGSVGDRALIFWSWVPSVVKARRDGVESVIEFFEDLDEDDDYRNGESGPPQDDLRLWINYTNEDYLILIFQKYSNGFRQERYKITVTDEDEPVVYSFLKVMQEEFIQWNGLP